MKFKHTFHVFVDNFSITYKQLLYRTIIIIISLSIGTTCLYPFVHGLISSETLTALVKNIQNFINSFLSGEVSNLKQISDDIKVTFGQFVLLLRTRMTQIVLSGVLILLLYIIEKWFAGLGNYTTAALINDKMAFRATSPFVGTMISHLKEAAIYNAIYVPLSILYDLVICIMLGVVVYFMLDGVQWFIISVFIFTLIMVIALAVKMTFTTDWLPALIRGKMKQKQAIVYSFSRKGKNTINILSNYFVLILIILAANVTACISTFGVGLLITIPASYVTILSFEMVIYYDREHIRYFLDKDTIIKPETERAITREEFFRGTGENEG